MDQLIEQDLITFLSESQRSSIEQLLEFPLENKFYSFCFNLFEFLHSFPNRSDLIKTFEQFVDQCRDSVIQSQQKIYRSSSKETWTVKAHLQIIFTHIPVHSSMLFNKEPRISKESTGKLFAVYGKIIKMQTKKIREKVEKYRCQACGFVLEVNFAYSEIPSQQKNLRCPGMKKEKNNTKYAQFVSSTRGSEGVRCRSKNLIKLDNETMFIDTQELHVFLSESSSVDSNLRFVKVVCEGEFSIQTQPGMSCVFFGFFTIKFNNFYSKTRGDNQLVFYAVNVQRHKESIAQISFNYQITQSFNKDPNFELYFRNYLIDCMSNGLRGLYDIKMAILLFMVCNSHISRHSDVLNILIIGEAQTGKTHLLNRMKSIFDLNYMMSSNTIMDTSNLTMDVLKEGKSELIEAGLLSVVNGDMLLIDDFNLLPKRSLQIIQESVREKKIINKKYGIFCDFKFGCLATCAPNSVNKKFLFDADVEGITGLPDSVANMFNLVFRIRHDLDYENFLIESYIESLEVDKNKESEDNEDQFIRRFVRDVTNLSTILDENCQHLLMQYAKYLEGQKNLSKSAKLLDTLVLLSKSHAKLFFRRNCTHFDAMAAIMLYESAFPSGIIEITDNLFYVEREEEFHEVYDEMITFLFQYNT